MWQGDKVVVAGVGCVPCVQAADKSAEGGGHAGKEATGKY